MMMKTTLIGWYNYDNTIFNGIAVPTGLSKQTVIDSILLRCGEFDIIYSNLDFLKLTIKNWSERHKAQFEKINEALLNKYDPLYNYDRYEEYSDTRKGNSKNERNLDGSSNGNDTTENTISADNSSSYEPDNKSKNDFKNNTNENEKNNNNYTDNIEHKAHLYGNIGVTTSQQMLSSEVELREKFGIYDIIAASFVEEFCIVIY